LINKHTNSKQGAILKTYDDLSVRIVFKICLVYILKI